MSGARGERLYVDIAQVLADSSRALQPVLEATPGWSQEAAAAARVEQVSGALTNLVYRCTSAAAAANATVIVRVFGSGGKLFSQRDERNIFLLASELGVGPMCLVEFVNGRVEEFLPGRSLSAAAMRTPEVSAAIAAATAAFHVRMLARLPSAARGGAAPSGDGCDGLASVVADLQDGQQPQHQQDGQQHKDQQQAAAQQHQMEQHPPADGDAALGLQAAIYHRILTWHAAAQQLCGDRVAELGLGDLPQELSTFRQRMDALFPPWIGFCHNDLQYGNLLLFGCNAGGTPAGSGPAAGGGSGDVAAEDSRARGAAAGCGEGGGSLRVTLIDYEYSTLNDVAFDVANFFCEWAFNYHSDEAHVFHDSWLPSEEQQLHFCRAYVAAMRGVAAPADSDGPARPRAVEGAPRPPPLPAAGVELAGCVLSAPAGGDGVGDEAAARLLRRKAAAHAPLSHLKWGLWGLIQDRLSDVDFDYLGYARMRLERYHRTKGRVLG